MIDIKYMNQIIQRIVMKQISSHGHKTIISQAPYTELIKTSTLKLVSKNHTTIWNHFVMSLLNHIEYKNNNNISWRSYVDNQQKLQQWLKQQIQTILKWMSNPENKSKSKSIDVKLRRWEKQRQEWERTFQNILNNSQSVRNRYEAVVEDLQAKICRLEGQIGQLQAKNSVLVTTNNYFMSKYQHNRQFKDNKIGHNTQKPNMNTDNSIGNQKHKIISQSVNQKLNPKSSNFQISSFYQLQIKSHKQLLCQSSIKNNLSLLIDTFTMTTQFLVCNPFSNTHNLQYIRQQQIQQKQTQTQALLSYYKQLSLFKLQDLHIQTPCSSLKQACDKSCQIEIQKWRKFQIISSVYKLNLVKQVSNIRLKVQDKLEQKQIQESLDCSVGSSNSSYILQADTAVQTNQVLYNQVSSQTQNLSYESIFTSLLLKISQLQQFIQNKNEQIAQKQQLIARLQSKNSSLNKQNVELKQQIKISSQIQQHVNQKYQQLKNQYDEVQSNYRQVLCNFSQFMSQNQQKQRFFLTIERTQFGIQTEQKSQSFFGRDSFATTTINFSETKSDQQDDQLVTFQSQQQEVHNVGLANMVNKITVSKYLIQYMKLELQNCSPNKKLSVFITILEVIGCIQENQHLIGEYVKKINASSKTSKFANQKQPLQDKLFKYLTENS